MTRALLSCYDKTGLEAFAATLLLQRLVPGT